MVLYQSFLELDRRNMVSMLAFDSKITKFLLDERFESYIKEDFPIFYKNKHQQDCKKMQTAIDVALDNN